MKSREIAGLFLLMHSVVLAAEPVSVQVSLRLGGSEQALQSFSGASLTAIRTGTLKEALPGEGAASQWKGPVLSALLDSAMAGLSAEQRAQIDVLILRGRGGRRALVPRALAVKYPILVATQRNGAALAESQVVLPWASRAGLKNEGAPLEALFVAGLEKIELANYRQVYGNLFLRRRTDPSAMRGEKLFVQNCIACHSSGQGPAVDEIAQHARSRRLADTGHPNVRGGPELTSRDRRALRSYLDAFFGEQGSDALGQSQAAVR